MKKKRYLFPAILFVVASALIVALIPHGGRYLQHYNLGERWKGETLIAPFDFSISKSDTEIAADLQHAQRSYIPVYSRDSDVQADVWARLSERFGRNEGTEPNDSLARRMAALENTLAFIYTKGIAASVDHSYTDANGGRFVRIDDGGTLQTLSVEEIFTPVTASDYLRVLLSGIPVWTNTDWPGLLTPNLSYNPTLNANLRERETGNVARTRGIVYQGEVIVANGQSVDRDIYNKLNSLKNEYRNRLGTGSGFLSSIVGYSLLVVILMGITFLYFYFFRPKFLIRKRNVLFVLMVYLLMIGLCAVVNRTESLSVYLIPFAIVPIYILTFFDVRMSIFGLTTILLLCSLIVPKPLEFIVIYFVGGIVAVFVLGRAYRRSRIFLATGMIFLSSCVCYLALLLIQEGGLKGFNLQMPIWFAVGAILFPGMYQLVYLFEKMFGFVSDLTLFELSDTNQKLLRELAQRAPGTFQHTLQVANLAEAAAKAIGARPLLARTGALYHDIGKMTDPAYFAENRGSGNNPHDKLTPIQSAEIIRRHVSDGLAMARKQQLPTLITEFITGHHGDSLIYYFYAKQKELNGGKEPDPALFRYEGAKPVRREVSICMMADSVEAASRSLPEYTGESIAALVDKIVEVQIREGALTNSELSFHDIHIVKNVFKEYLSNVYHTRISYPEREEPEPGTTN
jgi:putative nucleotidyltransferase with HDIG domain